MRFFSESMQIKSLRRAPGPKFMTVLGSFLVGSNQSGVQVLRHRVPTENNPGVSNASDKGRLSRSGFQDQSCSSPMHRGRIFFPRMEIARSRSPEGHRV